ncbi:VAMP-associated protein [Basidiobolus meristosporus CBS 931.73]|uniref:VAMP-associated protein n=1 Tax=Basidiobolus meristosporus CBS 931.73 TaxID=1314790 RepID=A0A1Y1Y8X3_9FUNG|nr:VAMP-associated protein [Basidiobolus meristosporus CBS 931.73]|eukprot:ORX94014.1 VAMP-associated protein [Basidiobolus meristosporus CBS 931.73]
MSLQIEPATQLSFRRPLTTLTQDVLVLRNTSQEPVAFKVKTTAPKQYCVRPNAGRIESGQEVQVQVILQPLKEDPPLDFKCKDKFLVQSIAITPDKETQNLQELWSSIETADKSSINERKLRCSYLPPAGHEEERDINPLNDSQLPPSYQEITPATASLTQSSNASPIIGSPVESLTAIPSTLSDIPESTLSQAPLSKPETTREESAHVSPKQEDQDLKRQLIEAEAKIQRLESQLNQQSIRNRQPATSEKASKEVSAQKTHAQTHSLLLQPYSDQTFPLQLVLVISVASFLLGAVFF